MKIPNKKNFALFSYPDQLKYKQSNFKLLLDNFYTRWNKKNLMRRKKNLKNESIRLTLQNEEKIKEEKIKNLAIPIYESKKKEKYRNKTCFTFGTSNNKILIGFSKSKTKFIDEIEDAFVDEDLSSNPLVNQVDLKIKEYLFPFLSQSNFDVYNQKTRFLIFSIFFDFNFILFYFILFYFILFYFILFYFILFYFILILIFFLFIF